MVSPRMVGQTVRRCQCDRGTASPPTKRRVWRHCSKEGSAGHSQAVETSEPTVDPVQFTNVRLTTHSTYAVVVDRVRHTNAAAVRTISRIWVPFSLFRRRGGKLAANSDADRHVGRSGGNASNTYLHLVANPLGDATERHAAWKDARAEVRNQFSARLMANIRSVPLFAAFYLRAMKHLRRAGKTRQFRPITRQRGSAFRAIMRGWLTQVLV